MNITLTKDNIKNLDFKDILNRIIHQNQDWNRVIRLIDLYNKISKLIEISKRNFILQIIEIQKKEKNRNKIKFFPAQNIVDVFVYDNKKIKQYGYIKISSKLI